MQPEDIGESQIRSEKTVLKFQVRLETQGYGSAAGGLKIMWICKGTSAGFPDGYPFHPFHLPLLRYRPSKNPRHFTDFKLKYQDLCVLRKN